MQTCSGETIYLWSNQNYHGEWSRGMENVEVWAEVCFGRDNSLKCVLLGFRSLGAMWPPDYITANIKKMQRVITAIKISLPFNYFLVVVI